MTTIREFLKGKKSYIIATFMVLAALTQLLAGDITIVEFVSTDNFQLLLQGLGLGAVRAAIKKTE